MFLSHRSLQGCRFGRRQEVKVHRGPCVEPGLLVWPGNSGKLGQFNIDAPYAKARITRKKVQSQLKEIILSSARPPPELSSRATPVG